MAPDNEMIIEGNAEIGKIYDKELKCVSRGHEKERQWVTTGQSQISDQIYATVLPHTVTQTKL